MKVASINLAEDSALGTTATVKHRKWLFLTETKLYVCISQSPLAGATWVDAETRETVSPYSSLHSKLCYAAQDEVRKECLKMISNIKKVLNEQHD